MTKLVEEKNIKNKEAIFGALSSFIRGVNLTVKTEFITNRNGVEFLALILLEKTISLRLQKKVLFLINELVGSE